MNKTHQHPTPPPSKQTNRQKRFFFILSDRGISLSNLAMPCRNKGMLQHYQYFFWSDEEQNIFLITAPPSPDKKLVGALQCQ
jgi:hypothetical protein